MDSNGVWCVSPSYDLTFSSEPGGEYCSMVMGEGKNPGISELLALAKISNIKKSKALTIIEELKSSVIKWPCFARDAGVSKANTKFIDAAITRIVKENF